MKHRLGTLLAACALAGLFAGTQGLQAQITPAAGYTPPDDTPKVNVGGVIYADYTYQADPKTKDADGNTVHTSAFNLTRAYINVTGSISHWVSFRITPDVTRETLSGAPAGTTLSTNGSLEYRLKYAYGQINFDDFLEHGSWIRFGVQQTPFIDYEEGIYRYRFQGQVFVEREGPGGSGSFLVSADTGASTRFVFPGNFGEVHAGVYNGEGYQNPESNDQKAYQVRLTLRPAPSIPIAKGLRLTGFYDGDHYVRHAVKRRYVGNLTFEHPYVNLGFDYLNAKDQQASAAKPEITAEGWSAWVTPRTPIGLEALLRYDDVKPNKDVSGRKRRYIAGLSYWFPVTKAGIAAALLADFEELRYKDFPAGNALAKPTERRLALHTLFAF
jgi:hypothetical protein